MTAMATILTEPEPRCFPRVLTPHRSLGTIGFLVLMVVFGGVSFAAGMAFLLMGAWPVFGFFGLDVLLIYWAFRINFRARHSQRGNPVTPSELRVRRVSHRGAVREWMLNPLWVQLDQDRARGIRHRAALSGVARPQLAIASFLGPDEKESFAQALGRARRGQARRDEDGDL